MTSLFDSEGILKMITSVVNRCEIDKIDFSGFYLSCWPDSRCGSCGASRMATCRRARWNSEVSPKLSVSFPDRHLPTHLPRCTGTTAYLHTNTRRLTFLIISVNIKQQSFPHSSHSFIVQHHEGSCCFHISFDKNKGRFLCLSQNDGESLYTMKLFPEDSLPVDMDFTADGNSRVQKHWCFLR